MKSYVKFFLTMAKIVYRNFCLASLIAVLERNWVSDAQFSLTNLYYVLYSWVNIVEFG